MVSSGKRIEGYTYQFEVGTHAVVADVSEKLGGKDVGPNPHEYLEVALAGCTSITIQMYASRKNIPLDSVDVKVRITAEGASNEIEREIHLNGSLSEQERSSLMAIAEKCPIHKFLASGATIKTTEF